MDNCRFLISFFSGDRHPDVDLPALHIDLPGLYDNRHLDPSNLDENRLYRYRSDNLAFYSVPEIYGVSPGLKSLFEISDILSYYIV